MASGPPAGKIRTSEDEGTPAGDQLLRLDQLELEDPVHVRVVAQAEAPKRIERRSGKNSRRMDKTRKST
jgi:hypothetical protein